ATTLATSCCQSMFAYSTSLTQAPELLATELAEGCYTFMFNGCESLSHIKVHFTEWIPWDVVDETDNWVIDVAPAGTFVCPRELAVKYGANSIPEGWEVQFFEPEIDPNEEVTNGEDTAFCGISVWTENGTICVCGTEETIEVFGAKGELIRTLRGKASETVRFAMPAGRVYILRIGAQRVKVLL
ncbi:MAG: hypothetical protein K6F48_06340, partial [Paludibacteraceae bacterium]|nr:hypothetical protein [Paludibacteraceae bacterium]